MSALLDTSWIIAYLNEDEDAHAEAAAHLEAAREGRLGALFTTDYVYDESVTVAVRRLGPQAVGAVDDLLVTSELVELLYTGPAEFERARGRFLDRLDTGLSLTDWVSVVHCQRLGIDTVLSFDAGFDGIHPRNAVPG